MEELRNRIFYNIETYWKDVLAIILYLLAASLMALIIKCAIDEHEKNKYYKVRAEYWESQYDACNGFNIMLEHDILEKLDTINQRLEYYDKR